MKDTYLLIAALPSSHPLTERTWSHRRKNFDADCTTSYVKPRVHWTESHQISTRCTEWLPIILLKSKLWIVNRGKNCAF